MEADQPLEQLGGAPLEVRALGHRIEYMAVMEAPPMPPRELRARVGVRDDAANFDEIGARCRTTIDRLLPDEWSWEGRRVLDFGCGPGRTLRHLQAEAERCELIGCDIHEPSVAWVQRNLAVRAFTCGDEPPLPLAAGSVDLVLAVSVFTHLTDSWAPWLAELARVLAPDGMLLLTFHGPGLWSRSAGARFGFPFDERIGMHVEQPWEDFENGHGPAVWHGDWWLREHLARGFELLELIPDGFAPTPDGSHRGQGACLLRRLPEAPSVALLETPGDDPRERDAALHSALLTRLEAAEQVHALRARVAAVEADLHAVRSSAIMRASAPLRRVWYRLRSR